MGEEMCCSERPEQNEISYLKPERNLLLNKYNSRVKYSISPEIKFESEGLNDKDDSENNNSLNIISNDELVYGTIDSLRYKEIKQKKSYNNNKISNSHTNINSNTNDTSNNNNNNNDNIDQKKSMYNNNNKNTSCSNIRNSKSIIDEKILEAKGDEDGPRDGVKKNKQQINEENIINTSNNPSKANELIDNNFFDSNNINKLNNIKFNHEDKDKDKDNLTQTKISYVPIVSKRSKMQVNEEENNQNQNQNQKQSSMNKDLFTTNKNNKELHQMYNYTESEIENNNNKAFNNNNNKNNRKVFVKPIISSLNNLSYNNNLKSKKEKKSYVSNDNINTNLYLETNNKIPNKTDKNNNIIQTDSNVIKLNNVKYSRTSDQPNIINNNLKTKENNVVNNYISDKIESEDSYIPDNNIYNKNSLIKENDGVSNDSYIQSNISKDDMLINNNNNNINQNNKIYANKEAINGLNSVNVNLNANVNENNKFEQAKTYISPKITFTQQEIEAIFNEGEKLRFSQEQISQITNNNSNNNLNNYSNIIPPESNNLKNIHEYKNCTTTNYKIINKTESAKPVNETKIVSEKEFKYPENITFQNVIYQEELTNYSNIISNQLGNNNTERALLTDKNPTINQYKNEYLETFSPKQEIKTIQPTTDYTNINQNNINYKINQTIINDNRTKPNNDIVYINKEVKKKNPNIMVIDNTKSVNEINYVNDNNKETIINNANKNRNSQKNENIIQYKYTTPVVESQPRIYSPTKNYESIIPSQTYVEYHGPKKVNETIIRYKTPIREPKKKEEIIKTPIMTTQNLNYYSPSIQEIKHTMVQSPTIIEKPIIQYNKVEQTIPITYSPAKYLPPIITYDQSYSPNKTRQIKQVKQYKQYKQSRPIPKVQKMKYNPYSLDVPQKVTNYNVLSVPSNTLYNTGTYIQQNISPYVYPTNEIVTHKDPSAPILNLSYLNTIQDINKIYNNNSLRFSTSSHSSRGSRGSSISVSKQKFDKFGNPIYASSLDTPSKRIIQNNRILHENTILKKNSLRNSFNNNNNINYSPFYYPRSLSQENFKGQKLRLDEFNDYSGNSSPYGTPVRTPRLNNNRNYGKPSLYVIDPLI